MIYQRFNASGWTAIDTDARVAVHSYKTSPNHTKALACRDNTAALMRLADRLLAEERRFSAYTSIAPICERNFVHLLTEFTTF